MRFKVLAIRYAMVLFFLSKHTKGFTLKFCYCYFVLVFKQQVTFSYIYMYTESERENCSIFSLKIYKGSYPKILLLFVTAPVLFFSND